MVGTPRASLTAKNVDLDIRASNSPASASRFSACSPVSAAAVSFQARPSRPQNGLHPVGYLQFVENIRGVIADGLLAQGEARGNGGVAEVLGDEAQASAPARSFRAIR